MPEVTVDIAGRSYRLGCGADEEEHLTGLAAKLDAEAQQAAEDEQASGPYRMAEHLTYDDIIDPRELRNALLHGLSLSEGRRG